VKKLVAEQALDIGSSEAGLVLGAGIVDLTLAVRASCLRSPSKRGSSGPLSCSKTTFELLRHA
jgi:hypothetical protein